MDRDQPWCYVKDENGKIKHEDCDIPKCADCPCGSGECLYYRPDIIHCKCDEHFVNHGGACVPDNQTDTDNCHPGPLSNPDKCINGECVYNNASHLLQECKCKGEDIYDSFTRECLAPNKPNRLGCLNGDDCGEEGKCSYNWMGSLVCTCIDGYELVDQVKVEYLNFCLMIESRNAKYR